MGNISPLALKHISGWEKWEIRSSFCVNLYIYTPLYRPDKKGFSKLLSHG